MRDKSYKKKLIPQLSYGISNMNVINVCDVTVNKSIDWLILTFDNINI